MQGAECLSVVICSSLEEADNHSMVCVIHSPVKGGNVPCWFTLEILQALPPFSYFPLLHCVKPINTVFSNRVGIIGAHCSELNSCMLKSDEAMEEDEQEQEEGQEKEKEEGQEQEKEQNQEEGQEREQGRQRSCSSVLTNGLNLPPL